MSTSEKYFCCVRGCASVNDNTREALFVFPSDTSTRGKRWLEMFPKCFLLKPDENNYICGRHFTDECFNNKGALLHRADPTKNIDTSYAQDPMLKTFLMKLVYEWSLRNEADINSCVIMKKATEAKSYLGMPNVQVSAAWYSKFLQFRLTTESENIRYGSGQTGSKVMLDIVKDIRHLLPSNITIPADSMMVSSTKSYKIKDENSSIDVNEGMFRSNILSLYETEEPADEPFQMKDVVPLNSLDTYQDALDLLKPLRDYIKCTRNDNAMLRLREVENVIKQAIKNDSKKPRKSVQRKR